jgi:8-oxo-dGTP pyrophosphatase MutT (NUDIX family)
MADERFYYRDPEAPRPNVPLTPGVAAVIFDDARRILILRRPHGPYWSLPGGRMDIGESAAECCVRETREETGLDTRIARLVGLYTDPGVICAYPDGNVYQSYTVLFECTIMGGALSEGAESERFHWLDRSEIDHYALIPENRLCCEDAWAGQMAAVIR